MYEIKISADKGLLEVEKDGVRVLRPSEDSALVELDAFLGVVQGSLDHESSSNVFLRTFNDLLEHLRANSSQKSVDVTVTTTREDDRLVHKFHLSAK